MITAYDKLKANFYNGSFIEINSGDSELIQEIMKEFAKLHAEEALKEASSLAIDYGDEELADNILEIYPFNNIK